MASAAAADHSLSLCSLCLRPWRRKRHIRLMSWQQGKPRREEEWGKKVRATREDMLWLPPWQGRVNYGWPPLSCRAAFCCSTLEAPILFYYCWKRRCSAAATLSIPNELSDMRSYQLLQQVCWLAHLTHRALTKRSLRGARSSPRTGQKGTWNLLERHQSIDISGALRTNQAG